jgi:hypothetical protein
VAQTILHPMHFKFPKKFRFYKKVTGLEIGQILVMTKVTFGPTRNGQPCENIVVRSVDNGDNR